MKGCSTSLLIFIYNNVIDRFHQVGPRCHLGNCAAGYRCIETCSNLNGFDCVGMETLFFVKTEPCNTLQLMIFFILKVNNVCGLQ